MFQGEQSHSYLALCYKQADRKVISKIFEGGKKKKGEKSSICAVKIKLNANASIDMNETMYIDCTTEFPVL